MKTKKPAKLLTRKEIRIIQQQKGNDWALGHERAHALADTCLAALSERDRLRKALEWYEDGRNFLDDQICAVARAALRVLPESKR